MRDLPSFCRHFYASCFLPVTCCEQGQQTCSVGFPNGIPLYDAVLRFLLAAPQNPGVYTSPDGGIYGIVRLKHRDAYILLGPAYSYSLTQEQIHTYMSLNALKKEQEPEITQFLSAIPHYSYYRFLNLLTFFHFVLNDEEISILEQMAVSDLSLEQEIAARHAETAYTARDVNQQHGTYFFERQMLDYVRAGDPQRMRQFLLENVTGHPLTEGKLADHPLRQAKNLLIGTVTMVGKDGAIPGGMDIEQVYQLIDTYIQECEQMQSVDAVKNLQFNMLIDFTTRVAQARMPEGISNEIFTCMQYISTHLTERITVQDVADQIKKSRAYTADKFKKETGKTVGEYITASRMQEARTLLRYTDKSLGEISDYLHFSSQPYFQTVFKKTYGMTPARFRQTQN